MGFDAFHASRNFHDPGDVTMPPNQNGIVFFPGSTPLYKTQILVGGFGISGDGVDQDDVVTFAGQQGFAPPQNLRADMLFYRGVRLPFQKFNRNPRGGFGSEYAAGMRRLCFSITLFVVRCGAEA